MLAGNIEFMKRRGPLEEGMPWARDIRREGHCHGTNAWVGPPSVMTNCDWGIVSDVRILSKRTVEGKAVRYGTSIWTVV
jgi:hypothetical protein